MNNSYIYKGLSLLVVVLTFHSCTPKISPREANKELPEHYFAETDTTNAADILWKDYFSDPQLIALIDSALSNNQELKIFMQEIEIARNEVRIRKGEYLPFVDLGAGAGFDKPGEYTRAGAVEHNLEVKEGKAFPEPLPDFMVGAYATWEIDVWKKLRNARKSALLRYIGTMEGRSFLVTNLIAEIANAYYELRALDYQLQIVNQNIRLQSDALDIVKVQKQSARVTELAVRRFEAQLYSTKSIQFQVQQRITETENKINFLIGRYTGPIPRSAISFEELKIDTLQSGIPSQLLRNRPDVRQAELELSAANLDIQVARANFYPRVSLSAGLGFQAFNPKYLLTTPESLMYSMMGDMMVPMVNRNAIKATYQTASAKQIQAVVDYERTLLNAYIEVVNQLSNIRNLKNSYELRANQVAALDESIEISNNLFKSARADYMEVLLTQREALEARFDLIETKMNQMHAWVNVYKALGGGWKEN